MSAGPMTSGHCLCGAVSYTISGDLRPIMYCHCEQCRRTSGHFVAATACKPSQISFDADVGLEWYRSSPEAKRGFCKSCGSNLFWAPEHHPYWSVFAGALDRPTVDLMAKTFREIAKQKNLAVILVTHDMRLTERCSDRVALLLDGSVVEDGVTTQILHNPTTDLARAFLLSEPSENRETAG